MLQFLDAVSKTTVTRDCVTFTPKVSPVQFELLQDQVKFHPNQFKNVWENEASRFCFPLTLWTSVKDKANESGDQW